MLDLWVESIQLVGKRNIVRCQEDLIMEDTTTIEPKVLDA